MHHLVLRMLEFRCPSFNGWERGVVGIVLGVAVLLYYAVERPCANLRKRLRWDVVRPLPAL